MAAHLPARLGRYVPARVKEKLRRWILGTTDRYTYVFVVTYGRSGSTLLMGVLNTIPGYRIHGENHNALYRIFQATTAVAESRKAAAGKSRHEYPQSPWYGILRARPDRFRQQLVESFVANVLRPAPGDRVLGFKEIRYTKGNVPDLTAYLDFLLRSFPNCKIVFNHRRLADVAKSSWWAVDQRAAEKLQAADARMLAVPEDKQHFHFHYDKIDDSLDHIRELYRFLGEEIDETVVREVLATRHSPPPEDWEAKRAAVERGEA